MASATILHRLVEENSAKERERLGAEIEEIIRIFARIRERLLSEKAMMPFIDDELTGLESAINQLEFELRRPEVDTEEAYVSLAVAKHFEQTVNAVFDHADDLGVAVNAINEFHCAATPGRLDQGINTAIGIVAGSLALCFFMIASAALGLILPVLWLWLPMVIGGLGAGSMATVCYGHDTNINKEARNRRVDEVDEKLNTYARAKHAHMFRQTKEIPRRDSGEFVDAVSKTVSMAGRMY